MDPNHYPRRILLCVTGLSAQIVTETLYCLAVRQSPPFLPTEIHLLTTAEGARRATLALLDAEQGHFHRLCADYDLPADRIRFDTDTIHIIPASNGAPLTDIRSLDDNTAAADAITAQVRALTADPATSAIHASIAGGRKTMGFYLGYALSLFGRPQDRLSHVLVAAPFESHPEFFYPPRKPRVLYTQPPNSQPIHTSEAAITLADIPFVRLRDELPDYLLNGQTSFSETVRRTQSSLTPHLVLDRERRRLRCGGDITVTLPPVEFAFYAWLARLAQQGRPGICRQQISTAETAAFLAEYRTLRNDDFDPEDDRVQQALKQGMDQTYFDGRLTRIRRALIHALGKTSAQPYLIHSDQRRPRSRYALRLRAEQIEFDQVTSD